MVNPARKSTIQSKPVHIIGLGGGGCTAAKYLHEKGFEAKYTCITNHSRPDLPEKLTFIRVREDSDYSILPLKILKPGYKNVLLVALGGRTGNMLLLNFATYLEALELDSSIICSIPFRFEGSKRIARAQRAIGKLKNIMEIRDFDLGDLQLLLGNMKVADAFRAVDDLFYKMVMDELNHDVCFIRFWQEQRLN